MSMGSVEMDHVADISKYTDNVDEAAVAGMAKTYRLVLSKSDTAVGAKLKGVNRKSRLTAYYLLAEHFNKLDTFK